jgi:osmotically-inducible protein OsmY
MLIPILIVVLTAMVAMRLSARKVSTVVSRSDIPPSDYGKAMMNKTTLTRRIVTGMLVAALTAGCASSPTQQSTGEYIDDSAITVWVKTAIYNDPTLKTGQIGVESYKGVVQLSGFVDSKQAVAKATQVASSVKGVKAVKNNLIVK